jgi:hypothetical protein
MRLFTVFLPVALTGMVITSSVHADEACTAAYDLANTSAAQRGSCTEVDGMCPDTCGEFIATLYSACNGRSYTDSFGKDTEYDHFTSVAIFQFNDFDGACAEVDFTPGEDTCDEAIARFTIRAIAGDSCTEVDAMCPDTCKELFATLDSTCDGESYTEEGSSTEYNQATLVATFQLLFFTGACADDADLTPGQDTCNEVFAATALDVRFGGSCTEVDGMCPDTCGELFTALDSTCAGKSYSLDGEEEEYNQAVIIPAFQKFFVGACADANFKNRQDTCTEAITAVTLEASAGDSCTEVDGMCPGTCGELFTALNSTCAGGTYTQSNGGEQNYNHFITVATFQAFFFDGACADADLSPGEDTCDELIAELGVALIFSDSCTEEVSGTCPDACEELFTVVDSTCDGKSYNLDGENEKYDQGMIVRQFAPEITGACRFTLKEAFSAAPILGTHASAALVTGSIALISSFLFL